MSRRILIEPGRVRAALPGYDAATAAAEHLVFDSDWTNVPFVMSGTASGNVSDGITVNFPFTMPAIPHVEAFDVTTGRQTAGLSSMTHCSRPNATNETDRGMVPYFEVSVTTTGFTIQRPADIYAASMNWTYDGTTNDSFLADPRTFEYFVILPPLEPIASPNPTYRVRIGERSGAYGMWVTRPGANVNTATDVRDFIIDSERGQFGQVIDIGHYAVDIPYGGATVTESVTFPAGLEGVPFAVCIARYYDWITSGGKPFMPARTERGFNASQANFFASVTAGGMTFPMTPPDYAGFTRSWVVHFMVFPQ